MNGTDDDGRQTILHVVRDNPVRVVALGVVSSLLAAFILASIPASKSSSPSHPSEPGAVKQHKSPGPKALSRPTYLDTLPETTGDDVTPGQVSIGGRSYEHGVQFDVSWAKDIVEADYSIPRGARTFSVAIGNDDDQPNESWYGIPLLYEVLVDGRRVATGHARGRAHDPPLHADVTGGSTLALRVTNIGDQFGGTNADWANPRFH